MNRFALTLAGLFVALSLAPDAQTTNAASRDTLLVTPQWLAAHLHDPDLVLVHAGMPDSYESGHIPGARLPDLRSVPDGGHGMPSAAAIHDVLASVGAGDTSHVVVYAPPGMGLNAAIIRFAFESAGFANASLLDGGMHAWTAAGQPLSKEAPLPRTGTLGPLTERPYFVDAAFVQAHQRAPGFAIVDARAADFYNGTRGPGHIPGAVNVPFNTVLDADGALKSNAEIEAMFARAGVKPGDTIVAYCHVGMQANAVVLAAQATGHAALLYHGSFQDWQKRDLPVENPSAKKDR